MACNFLSKGTNFSFQLRENPAGEVPSVSSSVDASRPEHGSGKSLQAEENFSVEEEDHRARR